MRFLDVRRHQENHYLYIMFLINWLGFCFFVLFVCLFHFLGRQLLIKAVNRVWTELIHSKKQVLEELFKVTLPVNERGHVDIAIARPLIEEAGLKCWQNHLGKRVLRDHVTNRFTCNCVIWVHFRYVIKTFRKGCHDGNRSEKQNPFLNDCVEVWLFSSD